LEEIWIWTFLLVVAVVEMIDDPSSRRCRRSEVVAVGVEEGKDPSLFLILLLLRAEL